MFWFNQLDFFPLTSFIAFVGPAAGRFVSVDMWFAGFF